MQHRVHMSALETTDLLDKIWRAAAIGQVAAGKLQAKENAMPLLLSYHAKA